MTVKVVRLTPVSLRNPSGDSSLICLNFTNIIPIKIKSLTNSEIYARGLIKKIILAIVKQIVIQIIAKQTVQKAITSVASAIGGVYISMQGLQMQSFDSIRGLRIMKPKVYGYLYRHNIETFWFLVQPHLTNIMKHIN